MIFLSTNNLNFLFHRDTFKLNFIVEAYSAVDNLNGVQASADNNISVETSNLNDERELRKVLDVFPDFQREFVKKILTRYESTESAIAAILEGNLPPDLDANTITEENSTVRKITDLINEMDFNIDKNTKIIVKSDKNKPIFREIEKRILDDKTHVAQLKNKYDELGYVSEEYEDEYDDSYDALAESETKSVSKLLKKSGAVLDEIEDDEDEDSENDEDSNNGNDDNTRDTSRDFCENPEAIRERRARAFNDRMKKHSNNPSSR